MPDTSYDFLTIFFRDHLPFCPTPKQVELFQIDLNLVSPMLMLASLREVANGTKGNILVYETNEWRGAIFDVYNRKVAEHAQLFPIFHAFETAFRSTVAVTLERQYMHTKWWMGVFSKVRAGGAPHEITQISGVPLRRDVAYLIAKIVESMRPDDVNRCQNGYEFTERCDLSHIGQLIEEHWFLFASKFERIDLAKGTTIKKLTLLDFKAKFKRVRVARNDVYHHKSVAKMPGVVGAAEELLDFLNFSLSFVFKKVTECKLQQPRFLIAVEDDRHHTWKPRADRIAHAK